MHSMAHHHGLPGGPQCVGPQGVIYKALPGGGHHGMDAEYAAHMSRQMGGGGPPTPPTTPNQPHMGRKGELWKHDFLYTVEPR